MTAHRAVATGDRRRHACRHRCLIGILRYAVALQFDGNSATELVLPVLKSTEVGRRLQSRSWFCTRIQSRVSHAKDCCHHRFGPLVPKIAMILYDTGSTLTSQYGTSTSFTRFMCQSSSVPFGPSRVNTSPVKLCLRFVSKAGNPWDEIVFGSFSVT